jgi:hypothetical protein
VGIESFSRQWHDPIAGPSLRAIGVELPEQLGALFIADAALLRKISQHTPPLVDDFPLRWGDQLVTRTQNVGFYVDLMNVRATSKRFRASRFIGALWPPSLRRPTLGQFEYQAIINQHFLPLERLSPAHRLERLDRVIADTALVTLPLWLLGTDEEEVRIAERVARRDASATHEILYRLGARALSRRDFSHAAELFQRAIEAGAPVPTSGPTLAYALARAGRLDEVREVERALASGRKRQPVELGAWAWLHRRFDL